LQLPHKAVKQVIDRVYAINIAYKFYLTETTIMTIFKAVDKRMIF